MSQIQTNSNIVSTINLKSTGLNIGSNRWEINYSVVETSLFGANVLNTRERTFVIQDRLETPILDENGDVIGTNPATTDLTEFFAAFSGQQSLIDLSIEKAIAHAGLVEWVDPTDDLLDDPTATDVKPWVPNEPVVVTMVRSFGGTNYDVVIPHTTQVDWQPNVATTLWSVSVDQGGGDLPDWAPWPGSGPTYQVGDQVSHNGQDWQSDTANNVWEPGVFGWFVINE